MGETKNLNMYTYIGVVLVIFGVCLCVQSKIEVAPHEVIMSHIPMQQEFILKPRQRTTIEDHREIISP